MSKPVLFLETTIQIERVIGSYARQTNLQNELAAYRLITSTYVLGEFLRTVVKDAIQLHRLIEQQNYFEDALTAIGQHPNKRVASRMLLILSEILRAERTSKQKFYEPIEPRFLDRLSRNIEFAFTNRFMAGIDELIDQSRCGLAQERPTSSELSLNNEPIYQLRSQCIRKVRECDLAERMEEWQPDLKAIVQGLSQETDLSLVRMRQLAEQILENPVVARGRNCTWYLGDMVIALELPADVPLYTTNRRHFAPLLAILNKKLHIPEPSQ